MAEAQYSIGLAYATGEGVDKDNIQAAYWYTKSSEQGFTMAQYNLGYMFANGIGVAKDEKKAFSLFSKAAEQGMAKAQMFIGFMYRDGTGLPKNILKAHMWFNLASSSGETYPLEVMNHTEKFMSLLQISKAMKMAEQCRAKSY